MEKFFNTTGPIIPEDHYYISSFERIDWEDFQHLIARKRYFLLHAPRQTGKTSALLEMMLALNAADKYHVLYANIEPDYHQSSGKQKKTIGCSLCEHPGMSY